tara:strand:- start:19954 stop:20358 length:405 start_codon:yes stop_codon:yes gene_type:complete
MTTQDGLLVITELISKGSILNEYLISYIFDERGYTDEETLNEIYKEVIGKEAGLLSEGRVGPFSSMEEIQKYSFKVCQEVGASCVQILGSEDVNTALEKSFNGTDLINGLWELGNRMENPDAQNSKGLLGKIFR